MNRSQVAFVDPAVGDALLIAGSLQLGIEAILLDGSRPALAQMAAALAGRRDLAVVHVIAHGRAGQIDFAAGAVTRACLPAHADDLALLRRALSAAGELRLWSCEAALGPEGAVFVAALGDALGAPVLASTRLVGAADRAGQWELDVPAGVSPPPPLTPSGVAAFAGVLASFTATAGTDTFNGTTASDTFIVATGTVSATDTFSAGGDPGIDVIQIGTAGAGTSVDLSAAATDGVAGFLDFEAITFVNTSGTSTATFNAAQFGAGKISTTAAITGTAFTQALVVNTSAGTSVDLSGWTFATWTSGTDTISIGAATGDEILVGSSQADRFVVNATNQVSLADRYDGGAGNDVLQIGSTTTGVAVDLSAAASDGVNGFVGIEGISFINTSGTSTATFGSAQLGAGKISNAAVITGASSTQAIAINAAVGGSVDLSGWTFSGWTSGTDTITLTGSTGDEILVGSSQIDRFVVSDTAQVSGADRYDGGAGNDVLQIGSTTTGVTVDLSAAASDGVNGFVSIEGLAFVNTSGTSTVTLGSAQLGAGRVSNASVITGASSTQAIAINAALGGSVDLSGWTFSGWTSGTDTISIMGSTGDEILVGSSQIDRFVVGDTNQVSAADRYNGGAGNDVIQVGVAGAGTSIDLSAAADDGVNGFLSVESITFVNTSGTATATLDATQIGTGKISAASAITGTAATQAVAINLSAGGALDLSAWTFATWTSGTDTISITGSTGDEIIVGSSQIDRFVVSDTSQVSAADRYNGGAGNDVIQVGVAGAGTSIDLSAAASDGVNGFLSVEGITFVNTSGTSTATLAAAQVGTGKIATAAAITGTAADQALAINVASGGSIDLTTWTFTTWTSGTDTITLTGSTGTEIIVGSTQVDRFVVSDSNQVSATDRYNGGAGNDILQVGVAGAGTSIDLSTAAADGVNGFLNVEGIAFVNTSGTSSATLNAAQFGTGKIAVTAAITGTLGAVQALTVNVAAAGSIDLSTWTFANWTSGTDTITVNGLTGAETLTGATEAVRILAGAGTDTLIVTNTNQVQAGDRYDGGDDADTLRIGTTTGTAIDLSAAASDGVDGFVNIERVTFANTSGTTTATFNASQFGTGRISSTALFTGTTQVQAVAVNLSAGGSFDMSGWTFATWTSGTDIITVTGSTGDETIVGSSQIDRFVVGATSQVSAADRYDGAAGNDILQIGVAGAGTAIDLSAAASDGVNGFVSVEALTFANTSGTSNATFNSAQFGTGKIATTAAITGVATSTQALVVNMATAGALNMSGWTFATWTAGTDTITINGSSGADTITGPIQGATILAGAGNDTLIVSATTQVQSNDRYDGGSDIDTLQIGTVGAGVTVSLTAAASDGIDGFVNIEAISFVNTSTTSTATFNASQFGAGKISTAATITGTAAGVQGLAVNLAAGNSLDLSGLTFVTWVSGTDTISLTGSTGTESIVGTSQIDRFVVGASNQISAGDLYDGRAGNDVIQVGATTAAVSIDLSTAASDGVNGFISVEGITFVNSAGTSTATFNANQFGAGKISSTAIVTGTTSTQAIVVNVDSGGSADLSGWTFPTWTSGTDTITVNGAGGAETFTGAIHGTTILAGSGNDTLIVSNTTQVQVSDRYDGGADTDTLQVGLVGAGTSISLAAAATNGIDGFVNIEGVAFVNTSGTSTATFGSAQIGAGKISNTALITGTASTQALALNMATGGSLDLSGWTFTGWTSGTDTITLTGSTGNEIFVGSSQTDTLFVGATAQVSAGDRYDGGAGNDILQVGAAGGGVTIDFSAAARDGVNGFLNVEAVNFTNTSGTSVATFNAGQFGAGKISNSVAITGTASTQALAINLSAAGSLDMSGWTFGTWTSGTDTITVTGSTGDEIVVGSSLIDRFVVSASNQVTSGDRYNGGASNDILQVGLAAAGTSIDLSAAASDGVNGFLSVEAIAFVNTSGTSTATFNANQFGTGKIASTVAVTGTAFTNAIVVNVDSGGSADLSGWTFPTWTSGTDTITVNGSGGAETITGAIQGTTVLAGAGNDTLIVSNTTQVQVTDRYDGGADNDALQIGVAGAGTSISLTAAATNGTDGFVNIEGITFVNTSGSSVATFNATQFGAGKISSTSTITGTASTQTFAVTLPSAGSFDLSGFTFSSWTSGTDVISVTGSTGADTIVGSGLIDTLTGGAGADTLTGGAGLDIYNFAAGSSALTIGGSGTSGTIVGYDTITDYAYGATAGVSEKLGYSGAAVVTAFTRAVASTLQLNTGATVKSHAISNGIITFDDATTYAAAVNLQSLSDVAAAVQYLQAHDIGSTGSSVAFKATIGGIGHTFVYIQGTSSGSPDSSDSLIDLADVSASSLTASGNQLTAFDSVPPPPPAAPTVAENAAGGINAAEAADGTVVLVSLSGTGAVAGDTLTVNWGGEVVTHLLTAGDIVAGSVEVAVPPETVAAQGDGAFNVTASLTDSVGNVGANSPATLVSVDTVAPPAPLAPGIAENGAGGVNASEASNGTEVVVDLSGLGAEAGDTLTVNWGGEVVSRAVTGAEVLAGSATVQISLGVIAAQGDGTFDVTASLTDIAGNVGPASTPTPVTVDTVAPAALAVAPVVPESALDGLNGSEAADGTAVVVDLSGSEAVLGYSLKVNWGGQSVTYALTAGDILAGSASVEVPPGVIALQGDGTVDVTASLIDIAGNEGAASPAASVAVDRTNPTVTVAIADASLSDTDASSLVTFTFSEAPAGFTDADLDVVGGTITDLVATVDPLVWTAQFTATDGFTGTGSVTVVSDSYTDAALNLGGSGSDSVTVDRTNPTVTVAIAESALSDGTTSSLVTFTFSEAPTGFTDADLDVVGGTITDLVATVDPLVWTAQFTATDGFTGTGSVTVISDSYTDAALNLGGSGSDSVTIDRTNPTVTVAIADGSLSDTDSSSLVTFTFSEAPVGFTDADLDVVGGTITDLVATVDPLVWTAQFTATDGFTGTGSVTVVSDSYTDTALNLGVSGSDSVTIDRTNPTVTVAIADGSLSDTDSSSLVTFTFSEAPVGFTDADLDVVGGTISDLVATVDPLVWTAQFTATDGFAGTGSVTVVSDSYTDAALNLGGSGSDSVTVDRTNPTVTVAIAEASLSDGTASSLVTFTFSEAPVGFTDADLDVVGGTITDLVATVDPLVWTAQFTATDGFTGTGSVTVVSDSYTDAALNLGGSGSDSVTVDRTNPTVTVVIADGSLSDTDSSSLVTFTFSEAPVGFTDADLDVVGGTITDLVATVGPLVWTAQFTATDGFTGTGSVTVVSDSYTDTALNLGGSGSDSVTVDRTNPTVTVAIADGSLSDTDSSSLVTFTFSEAPVGFTDADLDVVGGTITDLVATVDPLVWTAQFTATDGFTGTGSVTVISDSYTDAALNLGGSGSDSVTIDRTNPTVTVAIADGSLSDTDSSSLVTFTFSEAPVGFTDADLDVVGGTITDLVATVDPLVWTAQFTATDGFTGTGSVTVVSDSYTDTALNLGVSGSDSVTIDRTNPTVTVAIADGSLSDTDSSSLVTFTFSEAPVGFTDADLDVVGGTITDLVATVDPLVWTAQFTATDGFTGTGSVTVVSDSYTDAALNLGGSGSDSVTVDRTNPTVTVAIADGSLSDTDSSSLVTFTFSEAPVGFTDADLDVVGGTITDLVATVDPLVWTAQFTATDGFTGTGSVTVASDSYTDAALNLGGSGADSVTIDRTNPTVTVAIADGSLSDTDSSSLVTFTFSEAPVGFTDADLDVVGGTITDLVATVDPLVWTAQFTATDGFTGTGSVTVVSDSYTDAALNLGGSGSDSVTIDRTNPMVTVAIADGSLSDTDASSLVTFTFSEAPVGFTDADLDVVGGTITDLVATVDPLVWTAQFTATDGFTGTGSVTVASDSYTDAALNLGGSGADSVTIDRTNPTVTVAIADGSLSDTDSSSLVTFTFSEAPVGFTDADLDVVGGTITDLVATVDPLVWTAQFTATDGFTGTGSVTVISDSYTDAALNLGGSGTDSVTIDRTNPTVTVAIADGSLSDTDASSLVTFTFSEAPTGFTDADLDVVGGTITDLVATVDPLVWTAQFTATDGFTGTGSVEVVSDSYTDAALNLGGAGSDSVTIDRTNPTVTVAIADGSLSDTDASSLVTFTFSEAPIGFTDADLDMVGGTITDLVATVDPLVWTAQFTATDGFTGAGSVAVVSDSYTDAALNLGGAGSDSITVDRTNPTVTVVIADGSLSDTDASSLVTFTFSEAPVGFTDADLDVVGGTITDLVATVDPLVWTAQFTATDGFTGTGSVTVVSDSYTDAALNLGGSGSDSITIDRTNPTVTVAIADGSLSDTDASSLVTFTFSEVPVGFTDADLDVVGGTITDLVATVDPLVWTAQFTATDGFTGTGSVTVVSDSYTDTALNLGVSGSDSVTIDRTNPTVTVAVAESALSDGTASSLVTFTFSEAPTGFTDADLDVVGGTITDLVATVDPLVWTAQFTATDGFTGTGSVTVVSDSYTDAALNLGGSASDSVTIDRTNPTVTVAIADGSLSDTDASSLVTFTFSEAPTGFTDADLDVVGGTITDLVATVDPLVWTAQFTATDGFTGTGSVTVVSDSYTDAALNLGGSGSDSITIDRTNPTVTVAIADGSLSDTDASSLVTFTFSEAPTGFTDADLDVVGGTITDLVATVDPLVWTAQFTATDGFAGTGSVTVVSDSYTDAALNLGGSGSDSVTVDRTNPTVTVAIADGSLSDTDSSSLVTFTFSEAPVGFTDADLETVGGTITDLVATVDPLVWTAQFTATDGFTGTGSVSVVADSYTDAALNLGGAGSDSVTVDRTNPTVTVAIAEASLSDGTTSSLVTFTFSEAPTGFTDADLDVVGGTITDLVATVDPLVWTAQFTATDGFTGTGSVAVVADSYTDATLNLGGAGTDNVTIDRTNPTVTAVIADGSLSDTDASSLVTFTFSEAPVGFTDADLDVVGGTITDLVATVDPLVWTAQFTATDGFTGTGSVTVVSDSYTDAALNLGGSGSDSVTVDRTNPTVTVTIAEASLSDGTTSSLVTFTFSEAPTGFTDADLDVVGGTITDLVATVDPLVWTAQFTATDGFTGTGSVTVVSDSYTDAALNLGGSGSDSVTVDRTNPTVTVAIADGSLSDTDSSSLVTFTFSEAPVGFTDADLDVVGGTITDLVATVDPLVWTAQFTATDGFTGTGSVAVVADSYTDATLNLGGAGTDNVTIDRTNPTVTVAIAESSLSDGTASSLVTFTFSEAPTGFTDADLDVVGGTITDLVATVDPLVWTAQFTATDGFTGTGSVTVVSDSYTDAALNLGGSGTDSVTVDRTNPTVAVAIADGSLSDTDSSSLVTFTFSEAPVGFTDADLDVVGGTITDLVATVDPLVWTAQFTATDGFTGTGSVTVVSDSYTDAALNLGGSGSDSITIDRTNPTVTVAIAESSLSDGTASSLVTFTFSEAPTGFTDADLDVVGGTITDLVATVDPLVWTAQFTATDGFTGTGSVTVVSDSYTDAALNLGGSGTDSVTVDRTNPTVAVVIADGSLSDTDANSLVTFTFSEAPVGFTDADLDVVGGTISDLVATVDPLVWTAQFTATDGFAGTGSVTVVSDSYTDAALNLGGSGSDSVTVDRTNPTVTVAIADGSLSDTDASSLVTFTFSEAPAGFTDADLDVVGGTITDLVATVDPLVWTAQFTATDGFTGTGSVTVVSDSYTDAALNLGGSGSDSVTVDRTNPTVTVAIADGSLSDTDASSLVTFTFSEAPTGFTDADLDVVGGTITDLVATLDPLVWTAQFTATDGFTGTGSVTVASDSYTDAALNLGGSGTDSVTIDRTNPTVTVAIAESSLSDGTTSSLVTFTFSEAPTGFTDADLDVVGGTVTDLVATVDPLVWTAQFTATDGFTGTGSVSVVADSYTDATLNLGGSGSDSVTIDRTNPTVTVAIADGSLSDTDSSSLVTFTFSEAPVGFTDADLDVVGGTVTDLVATVDPLVWTAQFTATDGFTGTGSVTVVSDSYTDAALNLGGSGSDNVSIDRTADADGNLVLSIPDTAINAVERTAVAFSVSGIDPDVVTATVTFTDSLGQTIAVAASAGVVDMSSFVSGTVTSALSVVDAAGNIDSVAGAAIALDAVNGTSGNDTIYGTALNETFNGGAGNDYLYGREGADTLIGGADADQLIGGTGADTMNGGTGDDVYFVDNAGDVVVELTGEGVDSIYTGIDLSLAADQEIEFLRADAGTTGLTLAGNDLANRIYGAEGNDTLNGGGGDDKLIGGAGADLMRGGAGDDSYYVDNASDQIQEAVGEGADVVFASVDYTLADGQEIEFLRANAGMTALTLTGNGFDNRLYGADGNDALVGGGGNDRLIGGAGVDTMTGGAGDDLYYVDMSTDQVLEASSEGLDTVYASVDYTLADGQEIEFLRASAGSTALTLTGNGFDNRLYGTDGNDTLVGGGGDDKLTGGTGADLMSGGLGNDVYMVDDVADQVQEAAGEGIDSVYTSVDLTLGSGQEIEIVRANSDALGLTLTGNGFDNKLYGDMGDDTLVGGGGNDRLAGGIGADAMSGGLGDDVYYVDDAGDVVTELAGEGSDSLYTSVNLTLTAGQEIEFLRANAGATGLVLGGNDFDNRIYGGAGNDTITGDHGSDRLYGADGNDTLMGGGGIDRLFGNGGDDTLNGGNGNDRLNGGTGMDQLTGGAGNDTFIFNAPLDGVTNVDTILDYVVADDSIYLHQTYFGELAMGKLSASAFALDSATGLAAQIVYNTTTGALSYDNNGALAGGATQFAVVQGAPTLNENEFFIV
ncbi:DUF4347 domain-containing protein [Reyranella sp. MMS21-HV4-11]|uniref:DUF4347 domain-containing protein n=1 Tax=Reyranella humidisoli TaxID=2849149 RepID=A0ABS6IJC8_9HYPH|nr:DUF4347 domain-containing protein [Reyranella sp. MMS21-HV4-11]